MFKPRLFLLSQSTRKPKENNWLAVSVCVFCGIVAAFQVVKISIAAPLLVRDLSFGPASLGSLGAVFSLLGMVGGMPIASFALSAGLKKSVLFGVLLISVCSLLVPLFPFIGLLYGLRVLEGLGFITITVAAPALLQTYVTQSLKNLAMSIWSCFMPLGIAVMMFFGPFFSDWKTLWLANSFIAGIAFCLVFLWAPDSFERPSRLTFTRLLVVVKALFSVPAAVQLALIFLVYNLMYFAFYTFFPLFVMEDLGKGHFFAGIVTGVAALVNVLGNLFSGILLTRGVTRRLICTIAFIAMALLGYFIFSFESNPTWVALAAFVFVGIGGMLPTAVLSSAPLVAPIAIAIPISLGLYMQGSNLGQVLGQLVTGISADIYGWVGAAPLFFVLGAVGLSSVFYRKLEL